MVDIMETTKYIFGKPEILDGIGEVYPVKLKDYDDFVECSMPLYYSKNHFDESLRQYSLLELLLLIALRDEKVIEDLEKLFSIVLRKPTSFFAKNESDFGFQVDEKTVINKNNYEELRRTIMRQNLLFEQKVYKNKLVQEWANKAIQAKAKNSIKMEFEDMISTVSVFTGKHYWDLAEYTIYQLKTDFNRISKFEGYHSTLAMKCAGADVSIEHFAENIDMFKNPYDEVFKDKNKLNKLNNALK